MQRIRRGGVIARGIVLLRRSMSIGRSGHAVGIMCKISREELKNSSITYQRHTLHTHDAMGAPGCLLQCQLRSQMERINRLHNFRARGTKSAELFLQTACCLSLLCVQAPCVALRMNVDLVMLHSLLMGFSHHRTSAEIHDGASAGQDCHR